MMAGGPVHHTRRLSALAAHMVETDNTSALSVVSGLATIALTGATCLKLRPDIAAAAHRAGQSLVMVAMNKAGVGDADARHGDPRRAAAKLNRGDSERAQCTAEQAVPRGVQRGECSLYAKMCVGSINCN